MTARRALLVVYLVATAASALLVLAAPPLPWWGERHLPHRHRPPFVLASGHTVGQTFRLEGTLLDRVVIWVDPATKPTSGDLHLALRTRAESREAAVALGDIPPSGTTVFTLDPPLRAPRDSEGNLELALSAPGQNVGLQYQLDPSKYPDGTMTYQGTPRHGDLAFQLRFQRPALGSPALQSGAAVVLLACGLIVWSLVRATPPRVHIRWRAARLPAAIGLLVSLFFGSLLLMRGTWVGASDFSKDAAYLAAAADAVRAGRWPTWSHRTCGGMALLGNPEGNMFSLGTILSLALPPDRALLVLLTLEAGSGAAGTFALARAFGLQPAGSAAAAAVAGLSAAFAYRIVEGLTPVGGAVAFLPWAFLGTRHALRRRHPTWILLAGGAFAATLHRGDVHVLTGALLVMALWVLGEAVRQRSVRPVVAGIGIGAVFLLASSPKILPYLEQRSLVQTDLPPYVAPFTAFRLWDDVFLRILDRGEYQLRPLHDRRPEQWGNFGGHVGVVALVLAAVGVASRHRARWAVLLLAASTLAISEGTLFEVILRHQPVLGSLLRMPARVLSAFVVFLGVLAGLGTDRIVRDMTGRWPRGAIALLLLALLAAELGFGTARVLAANTAWDRSGTPQGPDSPTLAAHANVSPNHERHATKLTQAGFLLPKICGDQNNPPPFIREITNDVPLATVPADARPNEIRLRPARGPDDITVRTRFVSSWDVRGAHTIEGAGGALSVMVPSNPPPEISLRYHSATRRAQQVLTLALLAAVSTLFLPHRRACP